MGCLCGGHGRNYPEIARIVPASSGILTLSSPVHDLNTPTVMVQWYTPSPLPHPAASLSVLMSFKLHGQVSAEPGNISDRTHRQHILKATMFTMFITKHKTGRDFKVELLNAMLPACRVNV